MKSAGALVGGLGPLILTFPAWAAADLRPLKPAVGPNLWLPALLALLAVVVAAGVLGRLFRNVDPDAPGEALSADPPPPAATLRGRLERVRDSGWIESGAHVKACDTIAEVLRDLARARWVVSSPRLTTAELLDELASRGANRSITGPLGDVLAACDLVKFAQAQAPAAELRGHLDTAFLLVDVYGTGSGLEFGLADRARESGTAA